MTKKRRISAPARRRLLLARLAEAEEGEPLHLRLEARVYDPRVQQYRLLPGTYIEAWISSPSDVDSLIRAALNGIENWAQKGEPK